MSLVPNYIEGESGKWYENPVIRHKDNCWYICFDDDDPPELVIQQSACAAKDLAEYSKIILDAIGWKQDGLKPLCEITFESNGGERCFDPKSYRYRPAYTAFLRGPDQAWRLPDQNKPGWIIINADKIHQKRPQGAGCFHPWRE